MKFVDGQMTRQMHRDKHGFPKGPLGPLAQHPKLALPLPSSMVKRRPVSIVSEPRSLQPAKANSRKPTLGPAKTRSRKTILAPSKANTRKKRSAVRKWYGRDIVEAIDHQGIAATSYERAVSAPSGPPFRGSKFYPGLIDQKKAAAESRFFYMECRRLRRKLRFPDSETVVQTIDFAVSLAQEHWIKTKLTKAFLIKLRKAIQRAARRLSYQAVVTGIIDICPLDDRKSGVKGWAYHGHLTIRMVVSDFETGKAAIKEIFPYKRVEGGAVSKPVVVKRAHYPRGWDNYSSKLFLWGGVRQRVTLFDEESGLRKKTRKKPMTARQCAEWAAFISEVKASDFMVWVGYRRYKNGLVKL